MQKSLSKFAENRPQLASQLGITSTSQNQSSESESEDKPGPKSRTKRNDKKNNSGVDDDYVPDTFSALVGRKRKTVKDEKPPEIIRK